jgi:hypothetical protein
MKKVTSIVTAAIAGVIFVGASASAVTTGSISNTGPGSTNTISISDQFSCRVTNDNDIDVTNDNQQNAGSGNATTSGNTTGGNAQSGSAANTNVTDVGINITNGPVCVTAQPAVPGQPTAPPVEGGRGAGQVGGVGVTTAQVAAPAGGVGAGAGGLSTSILAAGAVSTGIGLYRLKKLHLDKA